MVHQDLNVISTITSEYTYTHLSLENITLINVSSGNTHL
jgi:hypothetical protein